MADNKYHWYDGRFYDLVIAPNQDTAYSHVRNIIEEGSTLLDAGCGTGRLSFRMADKCGEIHAVDLSSRNISVASKKLASSELKNITFHHSDLITFLDGKENAFDYAVLSYVIHEVDESQRSTILKKLALSAEKVILVDYLVPRPAGLIRHVNGLIEFIAGSEHYANFKTYVKNGGIKGLAKQCGLKIIDEIKNSPQSNHIAVLSK